MTAYDDVTRWILDQAAKSKPGAPAAPDGVAASVPADEPSLTEAAEDQADDASIVGRAFFLCYGDEGGSEWRRRVLIRGLSETSDGALRVHAYCFERAAPRAFRADKITRLICAATNEIIDDPSRLFSRARAAEQGAIAAEQLRSERALLQKTRDGVRLLMFLARCDDQFHAHERAVVHDYVRRRADMVPGLEYDAGFVDGYLELQFPDREVALASWRRILADGDADHIAIMLDSLEKLVGADGVVAAREASFLSLLKSLKQMDGPGYRGRGDDGF